MLNLGTYRHMTPERYRRYLILLDTLRLVDETEQIRIQSLYLLLDEADREPGPRQAMIGRLRRDGVIVRGAKLPIRYMLRKDRIKEAKHALKAALDWHDAQRAHPSPALTAL